MIIYPNAHGEHYLVVDVCIVMVKNVKKKIYINIAITIVTKKFLAYELVLQNGKFKTFHDIVNY